VKVEDMTRKQFYKLLKTLKMKREKEKERVFEAYKNDSIMRVSKDLNRRR